MREEGGGKTPKEEKKGQQWTKEVEGRLVSTNLLVYEAKTMSHDEPKNKIATR